MGLIETAAFRRPVAGLGLWVSLVLCLLGAPSLFATPIQVVTQPKSVTINYGESATFSVVATGSSPLYYQWVRETYDGANAFILGATSSSYTTSAAGVYHVIVSYGSIMSNPGVEMVHSSSATLTVKRTPVINAQPQSATVGVGGNVDFLGQTDGRPGMSATNVVWRKNGTKLTIGGRITQSSGYFGDFTLHIANVQSSDAGNYDFVASNADGTSTSQTAVLTVVPVPVITSQPQGQIVNPGASVSFSVGASGSYPLSYQWFQNGIALSGENSPMLSVINAQAGDNGSYFVRVSYSAYSGIYVDSVVANLSVLTPPVISRGPSSVDAMQGDTVTLTVIANGAKPLTYKWKKDGISVGDNSPTLTLSNVMPDQSGTYLVEVSNPYGKVVSDPALVNVRAALNIVSAKYVYSSPYLLDFSFSLRDSDDHAVVVDPVELGIVCKESGRAISPTETAFIVDRGNKKLLKSFLVLDYSASMQWGSDDSDGNGISDAIEAMQSSAKDFISAEPEDAQFGIFEFHADYAVPTRIKRFTSNKSDLQTSIDGILENTVRGNFAGTRCWDAIFSALGDFGPPNRDEQRYLVVMTDGYDESSLSSTNGALDAMVAMARAKEVKLNCIAFGNDINTPVLRMLSSQTGGRYYVAASADELAVQFAQMANDIGGQYLLRWATLKRNSTPFRPSFEVTVGANTASFNSNTNVASILPDYVATANAGDVFVGGMRLVASAEEAPKSVTLRATYVPRYVRKIKVHYTANYPCTATLRSNDEGEMLAGWSLTETNDGAGGKWLEITSSDPANPATSIRYGVMGNLVTFNFQNLPSGKQAFKLIEVDNSIYTSMTPGGQSFTLENVSDFITVPVTKPVVSITSPQPNEELINAAITVVGTASGGSAAISAVKVQVNGGAWQTASGTENWTASVNLNMGSNVISAFATDVKGTSSLTSTVNVLYVPLDTINPTLAITNVPSGLRWSNSVLQVKGTARDNTAVASVRWQLNDGSWNTAVSSVNWSNWLATVTLTSRSNTLRAYAVDARGNLSSTAAVKFLFIQTDILTVRTNGQGTITPNQNGKVLEIGQSYNVTASPKTGYLFSNWVDQTGAVLTNGAALKFVMQPGTAVTANFVPNPFTRATGTYSGLFYNANNITVTNAGLITIKLTGTGSFTASAQMRSTTYTFSGMFSLAGDWSTNLIKGSPGLSASLHLNLVGGDQITGNISSPYWSAPLEANRSTYTKANPTSKAGQYTLIIPGSDDPEGLPAGHGAVAVSVSSLGAVTVAGTLGDGTAITEGTFLTSDGRWPFYGNLYSQKGLLIGWMTLVSNPDSRTDMQGTIGWIKPGQTKTKIYPEGFEWPCATPNAFGAAFVSRTPVLGWASGAVVLNGGNLSQDFCNGFLIGASNRVTATNGLKLTITTTGVKAGLFSGTVYPVPGSKVSKTINGALFQSQNTGFGWFLGTNASGAVRLESR